MDKLDKSIADTTRFIDIERHLLQGSLAIAAAHRRGQSQASTRQAELNIETAKERLLFLQNQLDKKKRKKAGLPVEEPKRYTQLDLINAETPLSVPRISLMLSSIEFKLKLEDQFKAGREKMVALTNAKDDRKEKARLDADQRESNVKIALLKQALKKYNNLLCDEDEEDENLKMGGKEVARKPVSGKLSFSLKYARELEHAPLPGKPSSKIFNETYVEFKIHGNVKRTSVASRTDKWMQDFEIEMDKADEVEVAFYDQQGGKTPGPRVLIGVLWLRVSDLLEAIRKQKQEGEGESAGWVTAATVRDHDGGASSARPGVGGRQDAPLSAANNNHTHGSGGYHGGTSATGHNSPEGIDLWLTVEPQGAVNVHLDFVKENVRRRPLDGAGGLGRQGAVKKRKGEVHEMNGHQFVQKQFFQVILCALCNKFLMTGDGFQCEDCRYMCHEGCYTKVLTKCISKPNADKEGDEEKLHHNIPHRFEAFSNLSTTWCCHCGFLLPLGRKARKCTECSLTCHADCAHLVPNFCGLSMEQANAFLKALLDVKTHKTNTPRPQPRITGPPPSIPPPPTLQPFDGRFESMNLNTTPHQLPVKPLPTPPVPPAKLVHQPSQQPSQPVLQQPYPPAPPPTAPLQPSRSTRRPKIGLEDFNFLSVLGKGNFGKVMLAEEKKTNQLYAIKVLKKEFIIENEEVDSTKSEKRVFLAAAEKRHPFLLNLHSCFQTETRIYFVMEYISGGDLMLHIQRKQFTLRQAKFYACEVLLALEYFHSKGIIYRDLKLDNILLTVEGHIKVADYGLCKEQMWYGKTTSTFCGTPEFMAPEILMEQRYGRAVDWWAFGVLTYEMLLGQSPFRGDDEDEIFDAILEDEPLYPITMPPNAVTLLQRLLERDPTRRLGSGETDALEIKRHPFFADVNFDEVYAKRIPPTYFPNVRNAMDTSNFDTEFTSEQPTLTPVHGRLSAAEQNEFQGFSWTADWV